MIGMLHFNPRSPCGERRISAMVMPSPPSISIHAPRAGSDRGYIIYDVFVEDFNPRSPCGERRPRPLSVPMCSLFQSTLPVRGATRSVRCCSSASNAFQSTLPVRGATSKGILVLFP